MAKRVCVCVCVCGWAAMMSTMINVVLDVHMVMELNLNVEE